MSTAINPDDILSALYRRLHEDAAFAGMVNSIDKGPRRRNGYSNPSCTVHLLTAAVDPESHVMRGTAVVNVYMDDQQGRADSDGLGQRAERLQYLLDWAHDPRHPEGPISRPGYRFHRCTVAEPLGPLPSDHQKEHLISVRVTLIVQRI